MAVDQKSVVIDLSRDELLNDFILQTMRERYMLPGETSPQQAFARAAAAFADDEAHAQRLYDYASKFWFMFATPLLSNGGSERGLPISCFLNVAEDSREGIFDHWSETGWLSSVGGGVGGYWGGLRSAGEKTSHGSSSTGVIPFIATVDRLMLSVSQGGTRRGSYAAYLDISHPEIEEFITMRKVTGGDQNRKTPNLHNAVNITDEFMLAVRDDKPFDLRSPKTGEVIKTVKARQLWRLLIETRMQTGEPYMVFIDTINDALPDAQKNLGLKVRQSNLCVAPYTQLLTDEGYCAIGVLYGQTVNVWNGKEFTPVVVHQTGEKEELVRVWFEDGDYIDCRPTHEFYLSNDKKVPAIQLKNGDWLELQTLPRMQVGKGLVLDPDPEMASALAYAAGWATVAGFETNNRCTVYAPYGTPQEGLKSLLRASVDAETDDQGGMTIRFEPRSVPAGAVPFHASRAEQAAWLRGAVDASNTKSANTDGVMWHVVGANDPDLIRDMRLMALGLGMFPKIRITDTMAVFMLPPSDYPTPKHIEHEEGTATRPAIVADVQPLPFQMDTYCATEPKRSRLTFNGYVTGNCTEITLPTGRDFANKIRTAVCCLSSINAEKWDEWSLVADQFIEDLLRMLDNALTVFIETAPASLANAVYSATRERSVGIGLLGFQSYLQSKGIAMEGLEARYFTDDLFKIIRRTADAVSLKLGAERGEAPDMEGTGERFAHKLAVAPNASSSILCGNASPSIEPHRANAYLHKTLSGSFPVKNRYLAAELAKLGMDNEVTWQSIVAHEGSVQHLDIPDEVKRVFKTGPEIDQMALVQLAADRAPYICQAQSLNLFFEHDASAEEITRAHFKAWELGVKSLYYLRSTTPKRAENTNDKVARIHLVAEDNTGETDDGCVACEG